MDETLTSITIILDRSGSMSPLRNDVIEGVNAFIRDQQKTEGKATVSLVQFDDRYEENYMNLPLEKAEFLSEETYEPRGLTALLDAVGRCVKNAKQRVKEMPKAKRPAKNIVLIFTDGAENASQEWTKEKVAALVKKQEDKHNWKFVFLGANIDSFGTASSYGISAGSTSNFNASSKGIRSALYGASNAVTYARNQSTEEYTETATLLRSAGVDENIDDNSVTGTEFDVTTNTEENK